MLHSVAAADVDRGMGGIGSGSFSGTGLKGPLEQQQQNGPGLQNQHPGQLHQQHQQPHPGQHGLHHHQRQNSGGLEDRAHGAPPSAGLHSHRQNHNSSKLPAFRFADLKISNITNTNNRDLPLSTSPPPLSPPALPRASEPSTAVLASLSNLSNPSSLALEHSVAAVAVPPNPPNPAPSGGSSSADRATDPDPGPVTAQNSQSQSATHHSRSGSAENRASAAASVTSAASPTPAVLTSPASSAAPVAATPTSPPSPASPASPVSVSPVVAPPARSRASTLQPAPTPAPVDLPTLARRPASYPDNQPAAVTIVVAQSPHPVSSFYSSGSWAAKSRTRRSLVSRRSNVAAAASAGPPPALNQDRLQALDEALLSQAQSQTTKESPPGQRELILPKLSNSSPTDEKRNSTSHRPPVSYRPPLNSNTQPTTSTPVRVPPIRAFRSSGSRKSLTLDMNSRTRFYDMGDDLTDSNHDRTLRALEGRPDQDYMHLTPAVSSRRDAFDAEDTGDVFLKIAREESSRRQPDETLPDESQSVVSRVMRSSHRRPLSSTVPTYNPTSPPRIPRRLSDQESSRSRRYDEDRGNELSRFSSHRAQPREKAVSVHPGEDLGRPRASATSLRPSPLTPRSIAFQEPDSNNSSYPRRRSSITENNSAARARNSTYETSRSHSKAYNSSPLVRSFDFNRHQGAEASHGVEGTESTASTTAPSTVWDELDDLKSRIHRLELTGKLPSTSGAAISRLSDERPPTATTTVTTMSSSPKRPGARAQSVEAASTTSAQREAHPILYTALTKTRALLDAEVYRALESAANDAMSLSSMMGTAGQPGPISSGASTIGSGTTITDRQLRRKADSVCRSLTELCLALAEDKGQSRPSQTVQVQAPPAPAAEVPTTPTVNRSMTVLNPPRKLNAPAEQTLARSNTSPRAMSKFEERRINLLSGNSLPAPRFTPSTPATPLEVVATPRRSSLLLSRSRRGATEEPEEGRKSSLLLRTRRAGTEEPEEGRKTSLLVRNRRGTVGSEDDETRFRAPSRAHTELSTARPVTRDQPPPAPAPEPNPVSSSVLPRRRFVSSSLHTSRLATPMNSNLTPPRRYLERSTADRDGGNMGEKVVEDRGHRHMSLGQSMFFGRSGSLSRRNRDSAIPTIPTMPSSATAGGYVR